MIETSTDKDKVTLSEKLADFVFNLDFQAIPDEVVEKAKLLLLDTVGIMAAAQDFDIVKPAVDLFYEMGGKEESSVVGRPGKIPVANAAFCNGVILHSLDFDDTHLHSNTHVSATAVPTALSVGDFLDSSGEELLTAIIAGYEVGARIGAAYPWELHHRGFHPTSVVGTFIASTVAGKLMGLSREEIASAYGIAGSFSSGILQSLREGSWVKPFHPAWASHGGILAAKLAKANYGGPREVLEGEKGLYNAFMFGATKEGLEITQTLGKTWETMNISPKPYPSCHATHSSIDAIKKVKETTGMSPDRIKSIKVRSPKIVFDLGLFEKGKNRPQTPYDAKFSVPYTVAATIITGTPSIWDFTDASIKRKEFLEISDKVQGFYDEEIDAYKDTDSVPAKITVEFDDNTVEEFVVDHKGTPGNPVNREDIETKYRNNLAKSRYAGKTDDLMKTIYGMDKGKTRELTSRLS